MGTTDKSPSFFSGQEAAERLGVNISTIGRWVKSGRIVAAELPRRGGYVIPLREIERIEAEISLSKKPTGGDD